MKYDPEFHHRHTIRLKDYDYTSPGAYFVTICIQNHECLLGEIINGTMHPNQAGTMVHQILKQIPDFYPGNNINEFIVMPNHIHAIIIIRKPDDPSCSEEERISNEKGRICNEDGRTYSEEGQTYNEEGQTYNEDGRTYNEEGRTRGFAPTELKALSLKEIVTRIKTLTTKKYCDGVTQLNWPPFNGKLWQRNYYEHIISNSDEMEYIRNYIKNNPITWEDHPIFTGEPV